jgi:hypothetical protein
VSLIGSESGGEFPRWFFVSSGPAIPQKQFSGKKKGRTMTAKNQLNRSTPRLCLISLLLTGFGFLPQLQAVSPEPDGCYPGLTTAEGCFALFSLTGGQGNTAIGQDALFSDTTGSWNTGVGAVALGFNNGDSNTAVGTAAMLLNTSGFLNTAVGTNALVYNDSGNGNNAVGAGALFNNTDGNDNNAFGRGALLENIHAGGNTAIGASALASNDVTGNNLANFNTAVGAGALVSNTDGRINTAIGFVALGDNTVGHSNQAMGAHALGSNDIGFENVAIGSEAMNSNVSGSGNVAIGDGALASNVNGSYNTVVGWEAGNALEGNENIYIGDLAGDGIGAESGTIRIGNETLVNACYIAGIVDSVVAGANVHINPVTSQLSIIPSSERFKRDIKPIDKASESIYALKPVTFRYKKEYDSTGIPQFGLVAEEVAKVNPNLVLPGRDGKPYTVRYEEVNAMLLNEFLKKHRKGEEQDRKLESQARTIQQQQDTIAYLKREVEMLVDRVKEHDSKIQKVTDRIELNQTAPQLVDIDG